MAQDNERFERQAQASYQSELKDVRNAARLRRAGQNVGSWRRAERADNLADELCGTPLDVTVKRCVEILLCTGGPASGYSIMLDADGEPESGYYWYQDWNTGKRQFPLDDDALEGVITAYNLYLGE